MMRETFLLCEFQDLDRETYVYYDGFNYIWTELEI